MAAGGEDTNADFSGAFGSRGGDQGPPPKPKQGGWGDDSAPASSRRDRGGGTMEEIGGTTDIGGGNDSDDDGPAIPSLEQAAEEDMKTQVAAAPGVKVQRVQTITELDRDLSKFTLGASGIDAAPLNEHLPPRSLIEEGKTVWTWETLFRDVCTEIQEEAALLEEDVTPEEEKNQAKMF